MVELYTPEQRKLQEDFGTEQLADAHTAIIVSEDIPDDRHHAGGDVGRSRRAELGSDRFGRPQRGEHC